MEPLAKKWLTQAENGLRILDDVSAALQNGTPADRTLAKIYRENRCYGSRDRQFFYLAIFAWFRWYGWIRLLPEDPAKRLLAALVADGVDPVPPAMAALAGDPNFDYPRLATPQARFQAFTGVDVTAVPLVPEWTLPMLAEGAEERYLPQLGSRSPLWVRVLPGRETSVQQEWQEAGLTFTPHAVIPGAFRFPNERVKFDAMKSWKAGSFEVQDLSSQCIGIAAGAQAGENWLDACAGGGGKTLQLAAMMNGKGTITVYDIRERKLDELEERAARTPYGKMIRRESEQKTYDGVLIDAPCSSSGRWRRNPDGRWALTPEQVAEINRTQWEILSQRAQQVRPGGKLVYGTCSVFAVENILTIRKFLTEHSDFELLPFVSPWTGKPTDGMLQTFPGDGDCDGSFVAVLRRKK